MNQAFPTDETTTRIAHKLEVRDLEDLLAHRVLAVQIKNFFDPAIGKLADEWAQKNVTYKVWTVGQDYQQITDMYYGVGIPRQQADATEELSQEYTKNAKAYSDLIRNAFPPGNSPLELFQRQIDALWPNGVAVDTYKGRPGYAGILRHMRPEYILEPEGVCHIDSLYDEPHLSANLYLNVPEKGGELKIWNVALTEELKRNKLYHLMVYDAFRPEYREVIRNFLPRPHVLRPEPGDLILIDVCRPHAVNGFTQGHRTSLQTFIVPEENGKKLLLRT